MLYIYMRDEVGVATFIIIWDLDPVPSNYSIGVRCKTLYIFFEKSVKCKTQKVKKEKKGNKNKITNSFYLTADIKTDFFFF